MRLGGARTLAQTPHSKASRRQQMPDQWGEAKIYLTESNERIVPSKYMFGFMKTRLKDGYHGLSGRFFLARNYLQRGRYKN